MPKIDIPLLLKFGEKQHVEALLNKGNIFMQRLGHYKDLEKDELQKKIKRADKYDGVFERYKSPKVTITVEGQEIELRTGFVDISLDEIMDSYVYCMAGISIDRIYDYKAGKIDRLIPKELEKFGEGCAVITDTADFVKKFKNTFPVEYLNFIEYIDLENTNGRIGPFKKDLAFKEQLEFRFIMKNEEGNKGHLTKEIGALSGAFCTDSYEIETTLTKKLIGRVKTTDGKEKEMDFIDFLIARYEETL
ncbi:hypothetical protein [Fictibacillus terranigra]|uniref:Uncharacterized protein n=1 Tax=Fictibacillus terranigra TaxID=3058424 RepID=A0ABT8E8U6_9BACL|nr:hypothetical protein [Fictibacillus sp. CENA-BCM004]MDN4074320.1 hypothetical protein [Fictibacillus sp. CENA-BCM004]